MAMAPHILATLPLQTPPCGSQDAGDQHVTLSKSLSNLVVTPSEITQRRPEKRSCRMDIMFGAHQQGKPSQFNHFLSTAASSCAICPTFPLQKRRKRPKPLRNSVRHPTMIGCPAHHHDRFRFHDPTTCKENHTACHQQSRGAIPSEELCSTGSGHASPK